MGLFWVVLYYFLINFFFQFLSMWTYICIHTIDVYINTHLIYTDYTMVSKKSKNSKNNNI